MIAAWAESPAATGIDNPSYSAPLGTEQDAEQWLVSQIARRLNKSSSDIDTDRTFSYYGIDSLVSVELAHPIESQLGIEVSMARLLESRSIREFVTEALKEPRIISRATAAEAGDAAREATYPLSYGQRSLWFVQQMTPDSCVYNLSFAARIKSAIESGIDGIGVPTTGRSTPLPADDFPRRGRSPEQQVHPGVAVSFEHVVASGLGRAEIERGIGGAGQRSLRSENGPLFRVSVLTASKDDHILLILNSPHHLDFWSLAVLVNEFGAFSGEGAGGGNLSGSPGSDYGRFVQWQSRMVNSAKGEEDWLYWEGKLRGDLPLLDLPEDRPRPVSQTHRGASESFALSREATAALKRLSHECGSTLNTTLLAVFRRCYTVTAATTEYLSVCRLMAAVEARPAKSWGISSTPW